MINIWQGLTKLKQSIYGGCDWECGWPYRYDKGKHCWTMECLLRSINTHIYERKQLNCRLKLSQICSSIFRKHCTPHSHIHSYRMTYTMRRINLNLCTEKSICDNQFCRSVTFSIFLFQIPFMRATKRDRRQEKTPMSTQNVTEETWWLKEREREKCTGV